jgi:nucleotide-binding universal stress UspA family protein
LETLLAFAPHGIKTLTVVTAYPRSFFEQVMKFQENFHGDVGAWMESQLEVQNQKVIAKLQPLGCDFASVVSSETPEVAISKAMQDSQSELLILGSQGHGFFDRLTSGSLSYDEVMNGASSVLVLRAP